MTSLAGQCILGANRVFCDVDGKIYPCEKVNDSEELRIGDIYGDFDIDSVKRILNIAQITEKDCKDCWTLQSVTFYSS